MVMLSWGEAPWPLPSECSVAARSLLRKAESGPRSDCGQGPSPSSLLSRPSGLSRPSPKRSAPSFTLKERMTGLGSWGGLEGGSSSERSDRSSRTGNSPWRRGGKGTLGPTAEPFLPPPPPLAKRTPREATPSDPPVRGFPWGDKSTSWPTGNMRWTQRAELRDLPGASFGSLTPRFQSRDHPSQRRASAWRRAPPSRSRSPAAWRKRALGADGPQGRWLPSSACLVQLEVGW